MRSLEAHVRQSRQPVWDISQPILECTVAFLGTHHDPPSPKTVKELQFMNTCFALFIPLSARSHLASPRRPRQCRLFRIVEFKHDSYYVLQFFTHIWNIVNLPLCASLRLRSAPRGIDVDSTLYFALIAIQSFSYKLVQCIRDWGRCNGAQDD
jgi:hypothetical protein